MKNNNVNYVIVGLFVVLLGIALLTMLYQLTDSSGPTDHYSVEYNNVTGLKYGTLVSYEGYQIGQIENITPERRQGKMRYKVEFSINSGWQIPSDSIARVVTSGLISARMIDIKEGQNEIVLTPGAQLRGEEQVDLFAAINDVATDFHRLTSEGIEPTLKVFLEQVTNMTNTLQDVTDENIKPFFTSLQTNVGDPVIWSDLKNLLSSLNKSAAHMDNLLGAENQQHIRLMLENMEGMSGNMTQLTQRMEHTRKEVHQVATQLNTFLENNQQPATEAISASKGSAEEMHKTISVISERVNNVMYDLEGAMRNMHEFSREIRENPSSLINSSPQTDKGR